MAKHHDTGYKELFSHPEFVQQLIEGFAPPEIARLMDFSTLKNHSGHYITPLFEERFEDVVWSLEVHWQGVTERLYLYLLIEFQSTVDPTMPLRMLHYVAYFYQHLLKTKVTTPAQGLPPILPIVLYNGLEPWRAALDLPLVFARTEAGLHLLALLSPDPTDNAQIGPKGRWMGGYVPAAVRAYPFRVFNPEPPVQGGDEPSQDGTPTTLRVLVETDSDWLSRDAGQPLFEPDGRPSEVLEQRLQLLRAQVPNSIRDTPVLRAIERAKVLTAWSGAPAGLPSPLFTLSPERLNALAPDALAALRDAGALAVLYAQQGSLPRVQRLEQLAKRKAQMSARMQVNLGDGDDFVLSFDD